MRPRTFLPILLVTSLLTACSTTITQPPTTIEAPMDPPPSSTSITIIDALGREVILDSVPSRIVIAGRATALIAHSLYMFPEAADRIIALEDRVQRNHRFYQIIDPGFDEKTLLEKDVGPEQILPVKPDMVILKTYMAETLGDPLERLGIPVLYVDLETPEQFKRDVTLLGTLLGNNARAEAILGYYDTHLRKIQSLLDAHTGEKEPATLVIQYSVKGGEVAFFVPASSWLQTNLVKLAGGQPVWEEAAQGGGWTIVGFEQIAAWNPDKIFVIYYPDDPRAIVESLKENSNWQELNAAITDEIYAFAGDFISWDQPDPRWILGYTWLANKIHPKAITEVYLIQETAAFYQEVYGLDETTIETKIFPILSFSDS